MQAGPYRTILLLSALQLMYYISCLPFHINHTFFLYQHLYEGQKEVRSSHFVPALH